MAIPHYISSSTEQNVKLLTRLRLYKYLMAPVVKSTLNTGIFLSNLSFAIFSWFCLNHSRSLLLLLTLLTRQTLFLWLTRHFFCNDGTFHFFITALLHWLFTDIKIFIVLWSMIMLLHTRLHTSHTHKRDRVRPFLMHLIDWLTFNVKKAASATSYAAGCDCG